VLRNQEAQHLGRLHTPPTAPSRSKVARRNTASWPPASQPITPPTQTHKASPTRSGALSENMGGWKRAPSLAGPLLLVLMVQRTTIQNCTMNVYCLGTALLEYLVLPVYHKNLHSAWPAAAGPHGPGSQRAPSGAQWPCSSCNSTGDRGRRSVSRRRVIHISLRSTVLAM